MAPDESKVVPFVISWNFGHDAYADLVKDESGVSVEIATPVSITA